MLLFVDNLINVDFSYLDAERGIVGETWLASVELEGGLDEQGMVCDFGMVKKTIREWLDSELDHRLLVPEKSPALRVDKQEKNSSLHWSFTQGELSLHSPNSAFTFIPLAKINANDVAAWCIQQLAPLFPKSVLNLKLKFATEKINGPYYHYSHGLKKHLGNCQRIAHGHRSKIEIWINDVLAQEEMTWWANAWRDIYIGSESDLQKTTEKDLLFSYDAQQGHFQICVPKNCVYLLATDSTVELIAAHIAKEIKKKYPRENIRVKAFEGLGKGAIALA